MKKYSTPTCPPSKFCPILLTCEIAMFPIIQRRKKCIYWRWLFYITARNLGPVSIVKVFEQSFKRYFHKTWAVPVPARSLVLFFLKPLADLLDPFPDVPITQPCLCCRSEAWFIPLCPSCAEPNDVHHTRVAHKHLYLFVGLTVMEDGEFAGWIWKAYPRDVLLHVDTPAFLECLASKLTNHSYCSQCSCDA